ncbi:MAG: ankyrin repeat domain-containing protein, partial [Planctomycetes bacterium]|nr:ankyrin repeat domain-containing protein [Planctomycetota bacterium]
MRNDTMIKIFLQRLCLCLAWFFMTPMAISADAISAMDGLAAAEKNDQASVTRLLNTKTNPNIPQADWMTALLWAVYHDNEAMVHLLI